MPIHVVLISESRILADLLERTFERLPNLHLQVTATNLDEVWASFAICQVDVLMIDVHVGQDEALAMVGKCRSRFSSLKILPFGLSSEDQVLEFLEIGANDCLLREAPLKTVVSTLEAVQRGEPRLSPRVAASVCRRVAELAWEKKRRQVMPSVALTPRETQVLELIVEGLRNKEIASGLAISVPTVKNHVHRILEKLQVRSRRQAIRRAIEIGLVANPLPLLPGRRRSS